MAGNSSTNLKQLAVVLGEDAWQGDANAIVTVDGVVVFQGAITGSNAGAGQQLALGAFDGSVDHTVAVQFTNDAYGGSSATDRNLYVKDVLVDGASTSQAKALYNNGTATFDVPATVAPLSSTGATVLGSGPDTVELAVSEDAWQGDAQFVVLLDGQQVGGVHAATASHGAGQDQLIDLEGSFTAAPHTVGVRFLNDAWGGTSSADRNLYVDGVSVNGANQQMSHALNTNGDAAFTVQAPAVTSSGQQTIQVVASEDAFQGDAVLVVSVDGKQVGDPLLVTASHAAGATETFSVSGDFGGGSHAVSVAFVNDSYGGSSGADRNAYVQSVAVDGVTLSGAAGPLYYNSAVSGTFASTAPVAAPVTAPVTAPVATAPTSSTVTPPAIPAPAPTPPAAGASNDIGLLPVGAPVYAAGSPVETVGIGKQFTSIGAAVAAAHDGTVILVDAGTYTNDFATNTAKITLIAVGGRVNDVATVPPPNFKGLITQETDLTVEGFNFSGVSIPDDEGGNGAGIRVDGGNLVLVNDEFDHNQDGLLVNPGNNTVTIDHSVFNNNGGGDGHIHNVYIGDIASVTATNSIFENAQVGHEFKSRANVNIINNNEFIDGVGVGSGSYDIDLPNGGKDTVTNNTIIKGPNAENTALVHFGGEGIPYSGSSLTVSGNLFEAPNRPDAIGVLNQTSITAQITGNVFSQLSNSSLAQGPATLNNNFNADGTAIQNQQLVGVLPGSTFIATDSNPHTVVFYGGAVQAAQGGAGLLTVVAQAGHIIAIGGAGGMNLAEGVGSGGNQFTTAAGSTNLLDLTKGCGQDSIDSEGTDTILAGDGNQSAQLNGVASVKGGAGSSNWSVNGTASIDTGSGSAFITLGAAASLAITGTNDFYKLDSNGGTATWNTINSGAAVIGSASSGAFSMQVYNGVANIGTSGGAVGTVLHLDAGDAHVTSVGPDTIYAGAGNDSVIVSGAAQVYAGTGTLAVFSRGDTVGADVFGNGGDYIIGGDTGGITFHGGARGGTVEAGLSNITIIGGDGRLTIDGGSRDTVIGGAGGIVLNDFGNGANAITTAAGSSSVLDISGMDMVTSNGNDTIKLDAGNSTFALYGNSTLELDDGNSYADLYGTEKVLTVAGYDNFTAHAGASVNLVASNNDNISETGATLNVTLTDPATGGTVSSAQVSGSGSAHVAINAGSGIAISTAGDAPVSVNANGPVSVAAGGSTTVHLGAGNASVTMAGNGNEVWAGSGALTVNDGGSGNFILHGGTGAIALNLNQEHVTFLGGSGAATLSGGSMDIVGGAGNITVNQPYGVHVNSFVGGSGNASLSLSDTGSNITFGTGQSSIHDLGWGAADTFHFLAGMSGADTIENFRVGTDKAVLGAGVAVTSSSVIGGSAQFVLSDGAHVTFAGVSSTAGIFG